MQVLQYFCIGKGYNFNGYTCFELWKDMYMIMNYLRTDRCLRSFPGIQHSCDNQQQGWTCMIIIVYRLHRAQKYTRVVAASASTFSLRWQAPPPFMQLSWVSTLSTMSKIYIDFKWMSLTRLHHPESHQWLGTDQRLLSLGPTIQLILWIGNLHWC